MKIDSISYLLLLLHFQDTSIPEQESDQDYKSGNMIEEVTDSWLGAYVHGPILNKQRNKQLKKLLMLIMFRMRILKKKIVENRQRRNLFALSVARKYPNGIGKVIV